MSDVHPLAAALGLIVIMLVVSWVVRRSTSTTLDFYLAGRQIGPLLNACAICGDYFSAASFLGVAGAVYVAGADGIWFATGFAAGFIVVLLFLAAPFRRAGQFSVPDFLAHRFSSRGVRLTAVGIVQLIVLMYMVPQLAGAGLIWEVFVRRGVWTLSPYTTGIVLCVVAIVIQAVVGGMKGTTWNQALQFGLKLFTLTLLALIAIGHGFSYPRAVEEVSRRPLAIPIELTAEEALEVGPDGRSPLIEARRVMSPQGYRNALATLESGATTVELRLPADNRLHPQRPIRFLEPGFRYNLADQIALIFTLLLGTAGLPHIANRYFTSTSGRTARTSTVWVLGLAGAFYFLAVMIGVAARSELPGLVGAGVTNNDYIDGVVRIPEKAVLMLASEFGGQPLLALVSAAAFAAIFSTVSGLLIAAATSWGHDVYEQFINPEASEKRRIRFGQMAVTATAAGAGAISLAVPRFDFSTTPSVALMVTWAFAVAGSAFTPVFLLGVWWKRATARGALVGMLVGTFAATGLIAIELVGRLGESQSTPFYSLFPTIVAAPLAAGAMVSLSLAEKTPADATSWWVRVHGTALERRQVQLARLAESSEGAA